MQTSSHGVALLLSQVTKAVISVPAYFDERQREATMDAGDPRGMQVTPLTPWE